MIVVCFNVSMETLSIEKIHEGVQVCSRCGQESSALFFTPFSFFSQKKFEEGPKKKKGKVGVVWD